jgi:hypothetical protein
MTEKGKNFNHIFVLGMIAAKLLCSNLLGSEICHLGGLGARGRPDPQNGQSPFLKNILKLSSRRKCSHAKAKAQPKVVF